jgi:hypothetical protein
MAMPALETEPKSPAALALEEHLQSRIRATVHPDAGIIPGFIFTDPNIYQMELDRIFLKSWLFVAHTSEIPRPGDFVTREMAETSVVVSHGIDGQLRVFLNLCPHRGMASPMTIRAS